MTRKNWTKGMVIKRILITEDNLLTLPKENQLTLQIIIVNKGKEIMEDMMIINKEE